MGNQTKAVKKKEAQLFFYNSSAIFGLKMGKNKHKKHHRHGEEGDDASGSNAGLKLILKVGSNDKSHKKKKKKKEKEKERDKEGRKHRHHHKDRRLMSGGTAEEDDVKIEPEEEDDV